MAAQISLVITTYNRDRYLGATIASVLAQTYPNFELLIWDDGSTDHSVEIAQSYAQKDDRVRLIAADHQGRIPALRDAIAQTNGQYLGFVDSDDLLAPQALEETVKVLKSRPEVGLVYTDYLDINSSDRVLGYGHRCRIPYSKNRLLVDFITFHFRLMRRAVFDQCGGLDDSLQAAEDYDLCLRLSEVTEVHHLKQPLYFYRHHSASLSTQQRDRQIQWSKIAIERALQRRGLAQNWQLNVCNGNFILKRKASLFPRLRPASVLLSALPCLGLVTPLQAFAQPSATSVIRAEQPVLLAQAITPANDGTGTVVTPEGDRFNITGGQTSGDGANLFHSFDRFGLDANQTANFLANPQLQNILGRITGGDPSLINGLIQVTGGNANLFLLNPAGIVFGPSASLNIPASFTATTASGIGFGSGSGFNVFSPNDYTTLVGNPTSFTFASQPGAIINAGNLQVGTGQSLTLMGGTVVNTGQLSAPGGEITLAAVPGTSRVRISQAGSLLSLEIDPLANGSVNSPHPVASLPALLTGGAGSLAPSLIVNSNGQAEITGSGVTLPNQAGVAIASGTITAAGDGVPAGSINVVGDRVGVVNGNLNASGTNGGGTVRIGGDYQGRGSLPTSSNTFVSRNSTIQADAQQQGEGGRVIVWSDGSTRFNGQISARGGANSGNGGFVEVSGKEFLDFQGQVDTQAPQGQLGTLLLDPTNIEIVGSGYNTSDLDQVDQFIDPDLAPGITRLDVSAINFSFTNVVLQATNDITFNAPVVRSGFGYGLTAQAGNNITVNAAIDTNGGNLTLIANDAASGTPSGTGSVLLNADILTRGGNFTASGASFSAIAPINTSGEPPNERPVNRDAGLINITATNGNILTSNLTANGAFFFSEVSGSGNGGNITLIADNGSIATGNISANSILTDESDFEILGTAGSGGAVTLNALGDITTGNIDSFSSATLVGDSAFADSGSGGEIRIISNNGTINVGSLNSSSTANATAVPGPILFTAEATAGNAGQVVLDAVNILTQNINTTSIAIANDTGGDAATATAGSGGNQSLTARNLLGVAGNLDATTRATATTTGGATATENPGTGGLISLTGNSGISLSGTVESPTSIITTTDNNVIVNGPVSLDSDVSITIDSVDGGDITFNGTVDGANGLTLNAGTGTIQFSQAVGDITPIGGLSVFSAQTVNVGGNITTANSNIFFNSSINQVNILGNAELNAGTATIGFSNTTLAVNGNQLTLTADEIDFGFGTTSVLGAGGMLVLQPATSTLGIEIGGSGYGSLNLDLNQTDLAAIRNPGGFSSVTIGRADSSGAIAVVGDVTFTDPVTIQSPVGSGSITSSGFTITGADDASITLLANQNIATGSIFNFGRDITITSLIGFIDTTEGLTLDTSSDVQAGDIALVALGDITTANIAANSDTGAAGAIAVTSQNGSVNTTAGSVAATSTSGTGGSATINAAGDILTANVSTNGSQQGGPVSLTSSNGSVNTAAGTIDTSSILGQGGAITINAATSITTEALVSRSTSTQGGGIILTASGNISTGELLLGSDAGLGGDPLIINTPAFVTLGSISGLINTAGADVIIGDLTAPQTLLLPAPSRLETQGGNFTAFLSGDFTLMEAIATQGGNFTLLSPGLVTVTGSLTSGGGDIKVEGETINTLTGIVDSSSATAAGDILFTAPNGITTGDVSARGITAGGTVRFLSASGDVITNNIDASASAGVGGSIELSGPTRAVVAGNLTARGVTRAGSIVVKASDRIEAGDIDASASLGDGGTVTLDPENDIAVGFINAQGGSQGRGGSVDITTQRFFRSSRSFVDQNGIDASISTAGGTGDGSVIIRHEGGPINVPFDVGGATTNGTAAAITTGSGPEGTIVPFQSFPGEYRQGTIQIITRYTPPTPPAPPTPPTSPELPSPPEQEPVSRDEPAGDGSDTLTLRSLDEARDILQNIEKETGVKPALIYVQFVPKIVTAGSTFEQSEAEFTQAFANYLQRSNPAEAAIAFADSADDQLEVLLITADGPPVRKVFPEMTRSQVLALAKSFQREVTDQRKINTESYLPTAQNLYQLIVEPLTTDLTERKVENLVFLPDAGLRSLPFAALHNGQEFLVQQYSVGLMPSLSLVDTRYEDIRGNQVLATGTSTFEETDLSPLPAVPTELSVIADQLWQGKTLQGSAFTLENLRSARSEIPYGIIHLATHGEFQNSLSDSYIQLADTKLRLDQLRELGWNRPPVDLLVLSACRTALGNEQAELGFAGFAVQAGVKSALASLWYVSDIGTLALMSEFYTSLKQQPIKAEALRQAQMEMIQGKVSVEDGKLRGLESLGDIPLSEELAIAAEGSNFQHPYYWAAFTMIGNPW